MQGSSVLAPAADFFQQAGEEFGFGERADADAAHVKRGLAGAAGDRDVGLARFAGTVHRAAHHGHHRTRRAGMGAVVQVQFRLDALRQGGIDSVGLRTRVGQEAP